MEVTVPFTGGHMGRRSGFFWVPFGCVCVLVPSRWRVGPMCLLSEGEANESSPQSFAVSFLRLCGYLRSSSLTSPLAYRILRHGSHVRVQARIFAG